MPHEFSQILTEPVLHRKPQAVIDTLLLRYGKTHHEVVAHEIGLLQRRALEVEALKNQIGVVSFAQVDHDDHQALLDDVEDALGLDLFPVVCVAAQLVVRAVAYRAQRT